MSIKPPSSESNINQLSNNFLADHTTDQSLLDRIRHTIKTYSPNTNFIKDHSDQDIDQQIKYFLAKEGSGKIQANKNDPFDRSILSDSSNSAKKYLLLTHTEHGGDRKILGNGASGYVKVAVDLSSGELKAVKISAKKKYSPKEWEEQKKSITEEKTMLQTCNDIDQIIHLDLDYLDPKQEKNYFIMTFCDKGELFDQLAPKPLLNNRQKRNIILETALGISSMHQKGILHRDLKPENILLKSNPTDPENDQAQIIDLGFSCKADAENKSKSGTLSYLAPETWTKWEYSEKTDSWSLGVLIYSIFTSRPLCTDLNSTNDYSKFFTQEGIDNQIKAFIPPQYQKALRGLLTIDPTERSTVDQFIASFAEIAGLETLQESDESHHERGRQWLRLAAEKKNANAQLYLAKNYFLGTNAQFPKDPMLANHFADLWINSQSNETLSKLGSIFLKSDLFLLGKNCLLKAANDGYLEAQRKLAQLYHYGINGFEKNQYQAKYWILAPSASDCYSIGKSYYLGLDGYELNKELGTKWIESAVQKGDQNAQEMLQIIEASKPL